MDKNFYDIVDKAKLKFAARKIMIITHPVRANIIDLIMKNNSLMVKDIRSTLRLRQTDTSNHLTLMHRNGIVNRKHNGKGVVYTVNMEVINEIVSVSEDLSKWEK